MRNYQTKSNQGGLPDSITATRFGSGEFNSIAVELENAVSTSGQTLAGADGTGEVTNQLAMALAIYGAGGASYCKDTGAVNAYVLNPVSSLEIPPDYFDGYTVWFEPGTVNTLSPTVNVGGLGVRAITLQNGYSLAGGEIAGTVAIKYNQLNARFELIYSSETFVKATNYYVADSTQTDQGATSANPNTMTIYDIATAVGTSKFATILLKHNPAAGNQTYYTFDTSLSLVSYPFLRIEIEQGAMLNRTTGDEIFTVYGPSNINAGKRQQITAVDMIDFASAGTVHPHWWGARGNNSNDDYPAIQYAINAMAPVAGHIHLVGGAYLLSAGLTISNNGVSISGEGIDATFLTASTATQAVLTLSGCSGNVIKDMTLNNPNVVSASRDYSLLVLSTTVEVKVYNLRAIGGYHAIYLHGDCADNILSHSKAYNAYGDALLYIDDGASGTYIQRVKLDQNYPGGAATESNFKGWSSSTAYSVGDIVTISGYNYQCVTAGTSGGAWPGISPYETTIIDGTAEWLLGNNSGQASIAIGDDSFYTVISECDCTGLFYAGIRLYSSGTGTFPPQKTTIRNTEIGGTTVYGILIEEATATLIESCVTISAPARDITTGIFINSGCDMTTITGAMIYGWNHGIEIQDSNSMVSNNQIYACTYGIYVAANTTDFHISDNLCGSSTQWGANTDAIYVTAGTSDYYVITGNLDRKSVV